jgi:phosphatidylethanolamine/phosphatidyl-N-methylethanolamine N-methyltransferase
MPYIALRSGSEPLPSRFPRARERSSSLPALPIIERIADEARFLRSWLDNPTVAGAVSPSGRYLARRMARYVDPLSQGPIIELGPGTGVITDALLRRGIVPSRLFLVEYDRSFCKLLARRFPGVHILGGDAYRLGERMQDIPDGPAAAIVSSLPLLMKPERQRCALLAEAFEHLAPGAPFIQFTYGPVSPIPRDKYSGPSFTAEVSAPVWLNLPPARVWVYRRASDAGDAVVAPRGLRDFMDRIRRSFTRKGR